MKEKKKAIFCWSGGKDSAYCMRKVLSENEFDVKYIRKTLNEEFKRIIYQVSKISEFKI